MQPVDESVRFVEFVTQACDPAPGDQCRVTLHPPRAALGRFHLLRDFIDMGMQ
jgi:hypothetical protein